MDSFFKQNGASIPITINVYVSFGDSDHPQPDPPSPLVKELLPFFRMNRDKVLEFLENIKGKKPYLITRIVNGYYQRKELDPLVRSVDLFNMLSKHNIYPRGWVTWKSQVNFR